MWKGIGLPPYNGDRYDFEHKCTVIVRLFERIKKYHKRGVMITNAPDGALDWKIPELPRDSDYDMEMHLNADYFGSEESASEESSSEDTLGAGMDDFDCVNYEGLVDDLGLVRTSNIIEGGRRSRKGRATTFQWPPAFPKARTPKGTNT